MAHCPEELLDDLADILDDVRAWDGIVETRPTVFYLRNQPFLHFHLMKDGKRRGHQGKPGLGTVGFATSASGSPTANVSD
jgi:hypothetical protein